MKFTEHFVDQRTPEWVALRLGRVCGSKAAEMLAKTQAGKWAAGRKNLRTQLALERITGRSVERNYVNQAMQDGIDREADAIGLYDAETGLCARPVGFLATDDLMAGCSPDGVIGAFEGLLEVKAPIPTTHYEFLRSGVVPDDYLKQITHNLWVTGALWCDYLSYQPDFPEDLRVKRVRVNRDIKLLAIYEAELVAFLAEVAAEVQAIQDLRPVAVA